jgi:hypothetical protein
MKYTATKVIEIIKEMVARATDLETAKNWLEEIQEETGNILEAVNIDIERDGGEIYYKD